MKYCNKCGNPIPEGAKFCTGCGNKLQVTETKTTTNNNTPVDPEENKKANKLGIISVILYFGGPVLSYIFYIIMYALTTVSSSVYSEASTILYGLLTMVLGVLSIGCRTTAYVFMIIMRVKYPNNTFGKVLMWVYIGLLITSIVFTILAFVLLFSFILMIAGAFSAY